MRMIGRPSVELLSFAASFVAYMVLAAPGVAWMDSGELATAAFHLGGAHPPGHPLYVLLGKLASLIPIGEVAHRLTIVSALAQSAAIAAMVACARQLIPAISSVALVVIAALITASPVMLTNATRAEVYAPTTALIVWALVGFLRYGRAPDQAQPLWAGCFALGLAAAIHPLIAAAAALPMLVFGWRASRGRRRRVLPIAATLGLAPAPLYLGLWLVATGSTPPLFVWGEPTSLSGLFDVITAPAYQSNFSISAIPTRFAHLFVIIGDGTGVALVLGGLVGLGFATLTGLPGAGLVGAVAISTLLFASTQHAMNPDMPGYASPALAGLAIGLAVLVGAVERLLPADLKKNVRHHAAVVILVPLVALAVWTPPRVLGANDHDDGPSRYFDETVDRMPAGPGVYVADGDHGLFAAHYERHVAGARPDLAVIALDLTRDRWFLAYVKRAVPALYVPYIDDGVKGSLAERLVVSNLRGGRPVGADVPAFGRLDPRLAAAVGRGYRLGLDRADLPQPSPALAPPSYRGAVGEAVARRVGLQRAGFEAGRGNLIDAARAAGIESRLGATVLAALASSAVKASRARLYDRVPKTTPYFLSAPWQTELMALDLAWLGNTELPYAVNDAVPEIRAHRALVRVLGDERAAEMVGADLTQSDAVCLVAADLLSAERRTDEAARLLAARAAARPSPPVLLNLGALEGGRGDHARAAAAFEQAAMLSPQLADAWSLLVRARLAMGDRDGARAALAALEAAAPTSPDLRALRKALEPAPTSGETTPGSLP